MDKVAGTTKEDAKTLAKYDTRSLFDARKLQRWGDMRRTTNLLGLQMLMARKLCESGCSFVTVSDCGWDYHANNNSPKGMAGLDPMGRQEISQILKELAAEGIHIIISSHILAELETLCRHIMIMSWGRVLASGEQRKIRTEMRDWSEQLTLRCDRPLRLVERLFQEELINGFDHNEKQETLTLRIRHPERFYQDFPALVRSIGLTLWEMRSESRSLRNLFDQITQ